VAQQIAQGSLPLLLEHDMTKDLTYLPREFNHKVLHRPRWAPDEAAVPRFYNSPTTQLFAHHV
jgi:hypothetical protein